MVLLSEFHLTGISSILHQESFLLRAHELSRFQFLLLRSITDFQIIYLSSQKKLIYGQARKSFQKSRILLQKRIIIFTTWSQKKLFHLMMREVLRSIYLKQNTIEILQTCSFYKLVVYVEIKPISWLLLFELPEIQGSMKIS